MAPQHRRPLFLLVTWALLLLAALRLVGGAGRLLEPGVLLTVLALPWLAVVVAHGPRGAAAAWVDAFDAAPEDLPAARREASLAALRSAGAASVAVGLLGLLGTLLAALQVTAASAGNASPAELVAAMGAGLLAPLYGVALRAFLYAPLAEGLAGEGGSVES